MPSPTKQERETPEWNAIWSIIRTWDINVPEFYNGYCGANGSHVKLIYDAIKLVEIHPADRPWPDPVPAAKENL